MMLRKIISGGQTGADRGGLDAAIECGVAYGGYCPFGRRSEDGAIPDCYELEETDSSSYLERTRLNVERSDATLIFMGLKLTPGSEKTIGLVRGAGKSYLLLHLALNEADFGRSGLTKSPDGARIPLSAALARWIEDLSVEVLNVAGSRESRAPGIQVEVKAILIETIAELRRRSP